jgi:hypothetical protein
MFYSFDCPYYLNKKNNAYVSAKTLLVKNDTGTRRTVYIMVRRIAGGQYTPEAEYARIDLEPGGERNMSIDADIEYLAAQIQFLTQLCKIAVNPKSIPYDIIFFVSQISLPQNCSYHIGVSG